MFSQNRGDAVLPAKVVVTTNSASSAAHGAIGLGSWNTSVQYTNIVVTSNGVTLYQSDFVHQGTNGWRVFNGAWSTNNGLYQQTAHYHGLLFHHPAARIGRITPSTCRRERPAARKVFSSCSIFSTTTTGLGGTSAAGATRWTASNKFRDAICAAKQPGTLRVGDRWNFSRFDQ